MACGCCGGSKDKSSFADACYHGNLKTMQAKLKQEARKKKKEQVVETPKGGLYPIHRAAQSGNEEAIRFLIENKADPCRKTLESDSQSNADETPLHIAAFHRHINVVKYLLEHGAAKDVNAVDKAHQMTPLHVAIYRGCPEIVELLLQNGADLNMRDETGQTAYDMAVFWNAQAEYSPNAKHRAALEKIEHYMNQPNR